MAIERARLAEESATLARADERTRLAREIHDTLAQGLAALALQIETALREVGRNPSACASVWKRRWPPLARTSTRRGAR